IATAPQSGQIIYTTHYKGVNSSNFCQPEFKQSIDGGGSWTDMGLEDDNCRDPWVETHVAFDGNANHFEVYEGTGVTVRHQTCDTTTGCAAGTGNWTEILDGSHSDTSAMAFDPNNGCPRLLSSDGGLYRSTVPDSSCGSSYTWADSGTGLHAFEVSQLAGTVNASSTDLYFG